MLRYALILSALMGATLMAVPQVMAQGLLEGLQICSGDYALCDASTCTQTGGTIEVICPDCPAVQGCPTGTAGIAGIACFPEAECICPIFPGPALAIVNSGNMGEPLGPGDCTPPTMVRGMDVGDNGIWSYFSLETNIPQEINNWNTGKKKSETCFLSCSSPPLSDTITSANCFNFACERAGKVPGLRF